MQLTRAALAALLTILFVRSASAEEDFVAKTQVYVDNNSTVIVSPLVKAAKDLWTGGNASVSFVADIVSSASVDVVTNATTHMTDFRKEVAAGLSQKIAETTLSGSYIYSVENDYMSHNVALGLSQDLFQHNTTLGLGYAVSLNDVGRSGDPNFHRGLDVHSVDASWTQLLTPTQVLQLAYSFQYDVGYQASPYRFVRVEESPSTDPAAYLYKVPETDPNERFRHAIVVAWKKHIFSDSSLQLDYRFYYDNWSVVSHTAEFMYFVNFGNLGLRLRERFYYQTDASFFAPHYGSVQPYMTADRELSNFWSTLTGLKLTYNVESVVGLQLEAKVDVFYYLYIDYAYLPSRLGANLALGLTLKF